MELTLSLFVVFAEAAFPPAGVGELPELPGATVAATVADLDRLLTPKHILVWRHGSTFPNDAWPAVRRHLEAGGSLLYIGGEPFNLPVVGQPGARAVLGPNIAIRKFLRLNQCDALEVGGARFDPFDDWAGRLFSHALPNAARVAILEPRLCDTKDFPAEDGSPGSRDAVVRPLAYVRRPADDEGFPCAAAALAIDRLRGRFAGGRWVFWLLSTPPGDAELKALLDEAAREPLDFRIDPTFGCFHAGERPSVTLRCHRPRARERWRSSVRLSVSLPDGTVRDVGVVSLSGAEHAALRVPLDALEPGPGLYRVRADSPELGFASTGFWVFDPVLFASGDELTFDHYTLRRNGKPEPIVGTTVMSQTVHRDFLFEPNAAVWDDTFAELASLKVNLVRTGVWSGFRKITLDPGVVDEAWLRALEAYYLTARRHGIPVVFTFFAFLPEAFGGENPYFDPRGIEGQRAYLAAVASRFAPAKEILWDLINEPSFSSPDHLWKCRPNGDAFEERAFLRWLETRFSPVPTSLPWQDTVRQRWRLLPDAPLTLPTEADFADRTVFEDAQPCRAADYLLFAQEAFTDWAFQMRAAIRDAGSTAAITVGQDEGGLTQRPSPLFHHPAVDFTSMHTWWLNDVLLWDGLAAKAPNKPLLISETGVMNRELLSGEALRSADDAAKLLSRKIGYAFASGAFGVVQWCYDVNPYMASDNEVAIGLRRVDGSYKPEHRVLREFAAFVARNRERFESPPEPEVAVVIPTADVFSPRDHASAGAQRAVAALTAELGIAVRLVPDARAAADLGNPRAIVLPACRGISDDAWSALLAAGRGGARLICSGWFECDDAGSPAFRLGVAGRPLALAEYGMRFPRATTESGFAAAGAPEHREIDGVRCSHHPVPLEWSHPSAELRFFYDSTLRAGAGAAAVSPDPLQTAAPDGVLARRIRFRDAELLTLINETSQPLAVRIGRDESVLVPPGECRMCLVDAATHALLDRSHPEE